MANAYDFGDRVDRRMDDTYASLSQQPRARSRSPPMPRGVSDADNRRPIGDTVGYGNHGVAADRGSGNAYRDGDSRGGGNRGFAENKPRGVSGTTCSSAGI